LGGLTGCCVAICCFADAFCLADAFCFFRSERARLFLLLGFFLFSTILAGFLTGLICCLGDP
jgi:hypothetical protein